MTPREKKKQAIAYATKEMQRFAIDIGDLITRYAANNDIEAVIQASTSLAKDLKGMREATNRMIKSPVEDYHAYPEPIPIDWDFKGEKPVPNYPEGWKDGPAIVGEKGKEFVLEIARSLAGTYQTEEIKPAGHRPYYEGGKANEPKLMVDVRGRAGGKTTQYNEMLKNVAAHQALITPLVKPKK